MTCKAAPKEFSRCVGNGANLMLSKLHPDVCLRQLQIYSYVVALCAHARVCAHSGAPLLAGTEVMGTHSAALLHAN